MQITVRQLLPALAIAIGLQLSVSSVVQADLIGYWPFDELVEVDGVNTTPDTSPEGGHSGVLSDAATISNDDVRGPVLDLGEFDNGAGVSLPTFPQDERSEAGVTEGLGAGFNAIVESQEVTISYWMNRNGDDATNQWTFLFDDGGTRQLGSHAPWSNGQVYFDVAGCCAANQRINTPMNGADTDGEWHHLAYVKKKNADLSDNAITAIFLDGAPLVSSPGCDLACWADGATDDVVVWDEATISDVVPITLAGIGATATGGSSNNGFLDDFAIWDEALSTERIVGLSEGGGVIPIPEGATLGDFNSDGSIDATDFMIIASNMETRFGLDDAFPNGDMDGNLRINLKDFVAFRQLFESQAVGAAVPEPNAGLLLAFGALGLLGFRKRNA